MPLVQTFRSSDGLPDEIGGAIFDLTLQVWPPGEGEMPPDLGEALMLWRAHNAVHFVIDEANRPVLAHALIFKREIFTTRGPLTVGALAAVCVHPERRGRGWGANVVRAAFEFLPELGVFVSLFQTPVPQFYAKLGCRVIDNPFFDGTRADGSKNNPFWDACEMIYPAPFDWPRGEIDLNGPGY